MATLRRLTDSCIVVTDEQGTTLIDPGFHTWQSGEVDLETLGEVQRVLITHQHGDHVNPDFVRWLVDRGTDVTVYSNDAVAGLLEPHDIPVETTAPEGTTLEDGLHEPLPDGSAPPNRGWTLAGRFTHPGDCLTLEAVAPVVALPLVSPFCHPGGSIAFARRTKPRQVIPIHDFYLTASGREIIWNMAGPAFEEAGIELVRLGWGESFTLD